METKKTLKLEVKTLETRLAPGACWNSHRAQYQAGESGDAEAQQTWDAYWSRMGANEGGNSSASGTPIIGIN